MIDLVRKSGSNIFRATLPGESPLPSMLENPSLSVGGEYAPINFVGFPPTCDICFSTDHTYRVCNNRPKAPAKRCFNCGYEGHFSRDCPARRDPHQQKEPSAEEIRQAERRMASAALCSLCAVAHTDGEKCPLNKCVRCDTSEHNDSNCPLSPVRVQTPDGRTILPNGDLLDEAGYQEVMPPRVRKENIDLRRQELERRQKAATSSAAAPKAAAKERGRSKSTGRGDARTKDKGKKKSDPPKPDPKQPKIAAFTKTTVVPPDTREYRQVTREIGPPTGEDTEGTMETVYEVCEVAASSVVRRHTIEECRTKIRMALPSLSIR